MNIEFLIKDYLQYNTWANKRLIDWLQANPVELIERDCPSSFRSIKKTLEHIWSAQTFYLSIIKQEAINKDYDQTSESLFKGLIHQSEDFASYILEREENYLTEEREVKTKILNGNYPIVVLIQHCINHSTYHRGQIITMGHFIGMSKAPSTDYFFYRMEKLKPATTIGNT